MCALHATRVDEMHVHQLTQESEGSGSHFGGTICLPLRIQILQPINGTDTCWPVELPIIYKLKSYGKLKDKHNGELGMMAEIRKNGCAIFCKIEILQIQSVVRPMLTGRRHLVCIWQSMLDPGSPDQ